MYICIYVYMYICVYMCIYMYIYMYMYICIWVNRVSPQCFQVFYMCTFQRCCARVRDIVHVAEMLCTFQRCCARVRDVVHVSQQLCTFHRSCARFTSALITFVFNCIHTERILISKRIGVTKYVLPLYIYIYLYLYRCMYTYIWYYRWYHVCIHDIIYDIMYVLPIDVHSMIQYMWIFFIILYRYSSPCWISLRWVKMRPALGCLGGRNRLQNAMCWLFKWFTLG